MAIGPLLGFRHPALNSRFPIRSVFVNRALGSELHDANICLIRIALDAACQSHWPAAKRLIVEQIVAETPPNRVC
jgi:hypothetical protein